MRSDGIFILHPDCDGTNPTIIANLKCEVTMLSLLDSKFNLKEGDSI